MNIEFKYYIFNEKKYIKLFTSLLQTSDYIKLNELLQLYFSQKSYKNKDDEPLTGSLKQQFINVADTFYNDIDSYSIENTTTLESIIYLCIITLQNLVQLSEPTKNDPEIITNLSNYIFVIIHAFGLHYKCIINLINCIKKTVNDIMGNDYLIIDCKDVTNYSNCSNITYTCGRAVFSNSSIFNVNSKIIIYNTVSEYDDNMDIDYIVNKYQSLKGGSLYYFKYLKYKNKYLNLKK
jgi:hypothetical protein